MPSAGSFIRVFLFLLGLLCLLSISQRSEAQADYPEWCVADEQFLDVDLAGALDWACKNGADCSKIQPNGPCYMPNTMKDHASFAFNSYYQTMKHKGGSCYFRAAGLITSLDPSNGPCKYEFLP